MSYGPKSTKFILEKNYLEEILFDVSEDFCILFEFLLLRTALSLVFVVN
jgi:hypothetical protein